MRDFNKINNSNIPDLLDYIVNEFHIPLREDLIKLDNFIIITSNIPQLVDKMTLAKEIFKQFKIEFLEHINKEEKIFFPEIIKLVNNENSDIKLIKGYINRLNIEHNELKNYLIGGKAIIENLTNDVKLKEYIELKEFTNLIEKLIQDAVDSIHIEDNYLYTKINNLIKN